MQKHPGEEGKRGVDYRLGLIIAYMHFEENYPGSDVSKLLFTLCEIQGVLHQQESQRTNENILHLYLQTFLHMIELKKFEKPKSITKRKMFGKYCHAILAHASDQYRIINGRSANTETDERYFNTIKNISNGTSNHNADNVISNAFIRTQVRQDFEKKEIIRVEAIISEQYEPISLKVINSFISFEIIQNYPWEYQAMLEKIADFLVEGVFWIETEYGVQFNDVTLTNSEKKVHHFRSTKICDELIFVQSCWENVCLKNADKLIPAYKLKVEDKEGNLSIRRLKTLKYFPSSDTENENLNLLAPVEDLYDNIDSPRIMKSSPRNSRKSCVITSTPKSNSKLGNNNDTNNLEAMFLEESALSTNENIEKEESSDSENEYEMENDCIEFEKEDTVVQILPPTIEDLVLQDEQQKIVNHGKTARVLINVLGECQLIEDYTKIKKKIETHPHENMYWETYRDIMSMLEVKLKTTRDNLKIQINEIQRRKLKNNYVSTDLIPTTGSDKELFDSIIQKLQYIDLLKPNFWSQI